MRSRIKKILIVVVLVIGLGVLLVMYLRYSEDQHYEKVGGELIEKVEKYHDRTGDLPNSISELELEENMGEGPYYEKVDSNSYKVYFNIGFDNSKVYYSDLDEWKDEP